MCFSFFIRSFVATIKNLNLLFFPFQKVTSPHLKTITGAVFIIKRLVLQQTSIFYYDRYRKTRNLSFKSCASIHPFRARFHYEIKLKLSATNR